MKSDSVRNAACLVAIAGILLHLYLIFVHAASTSVSYYIAPSMNLIPYLLCVVLARTSEKPVMAFCAALLVLVLDLYLFHEYLFAARMYRFVLIEVYQTLFKIVVVLPVGCLAGFLIDKVIGHTPAKRVG